MEIYSIDTLIVGAGVVGIATAARLATSGRRLFVLERHERFGMETSSHNSEVIHAGIYYPECSLKARLCVKGKAQLYAYLEDRGIAHRRCGKLIVATDEAQKAALAGIARQGIRNGVTDLEEWSSTQIRARFPALNASAGLWSPSTGILDSHGLMSALKSDAESRQAEFLFRHQVRRGSWSGQEIIVEVLGPDEKPFLLSCKEVINCAGLASLQWLNQFEGIRKECLPEPCYAKGNYFSLVTRSPFDALVYPVPEPGGLGVHLTLDLAGSARFGPDVEWVSKPDYQVSTASEKAFYRAVRRYWPGLPDHSLHPGYCGIRPKLRRNGVLLSDFVIQGAEEHGVPGLLNLLGIESPGLTSCLALADEVAHRLL